MHLAEGSGNRNLVVERGADPSVLVVVFSGARGQWGARPFDFLDTTNSLKYSRILCRDPYGTWYHDGLSELSGIRPLVELMRGHIADLAPKVTLFIGNSAGGYAAILFGHLLMADAVHAFAPQTCLKPDHVKRYRRLDKPEKVAAYEQLWRSPGAEWDWLDLNEVLEHHNGRTTYLIHICEDSETDRSAADWVASRPGVHIRTYPCGGHGVSRYIAKQKLLYKLLRPDLHLIAADLTSEGTQDD